MIKLIGVIIALAAFSLQAICQVSKKKDFTYHIKAAEEEMTIDGQLKEQIWDDVQRVGDFYQKFPQDSIPAKDRTEVMLTRDEKFIYLAAVCYLNELEIPQSNTLFRDFPFFENDAFAFVLETYQDGLNGFSFEVTPFGSQGDRLISNGGIFDEDHSDYNWDNKWYSGVQRNDSMWIVEMAIPFKTLRFKSGMDTWGINFIRQNRSANTISSWHPIPVNLSIINLAFTGKLVWDVPPKGGKLNYSLIPSLTLTTNKNFKAQNTGWETDFTPSFDFKVNFGTSLNLDGTINPDFSQIEVDQRQLNIGRFELSLPERRQFFLENSDLFANFGNNALRPFFSRRIGLVRDQNEVFEPVPILGGLRLSGKLGQKTRVGVMAVQTDNANKITDGGITEAIQGRNYVVGTVQQQVFNRSTFSALLINTQEAEGFFELLPNTFNRIYGAQFDWVSKDSKWTGKSFYFNSKQSTDTAKAFGGELSYRSTHFGAWTQFYHIDEDFNPNTGFVPRTGIEQVNFAPFYTFRPSDEKINFIDVFFDNSHTFSKNFTLLDSNILSGTFASFSNTSNFLLAVNPRYTLLINSFDPSFSESEPLPEGADYFYTSGRIRYRTDQRKLVSASIEMDYGQYFNGTKFTTTNTLNLRWQPYFQFGLDVIYNDINLPAPFGDNQIFLIRPEGRISFNKNLFLTYITQYSSLLKTVGTNLRLQWRFQPASDIFVVYTDNYTDEFNIIQRGLSVKMIYWF